MLLLYKTNRRVYFTTKREVSYIRFINIIYKLQRSIKGEYTYSQEQMLDELYEFSSEITLWGSNEVIKKWVEFRKVSSKQNVETSDILISAEKIMNSMRKDLGLKKSKKGELLSFFINDIDLILK